MEGIHDPGRESMLNYIIPAIFAFVGLILLLVAINQMNKARAAEAWPTVPGVVLSSGLEEHRSYDASDHSTNITYEPGVQYQYNLMGQTLTGTHIAFGSASFDYNTASRKIAPYPQGAQVTVHYDPANPANPANAVLETKAAGGVILLILGIVFMAISVVFFIVPILPH
jgi:hypothetical protein